MRKKGVDIIIFFIVSCSVLLVLAFSATASRAENKPNGIVKMPASVLRPRTIIPEREPELTLMVSQGSKDKMLMAWTPGSDGKTPQELTKYEVYLLSNKSVSICYL
ncbi:MAG: hypothetical protein D3905_13615 [Candidatus Electrothrix sp. AS4_5]|nr:hypothetical protein [Candidatus Electrothrix gigas]